MKKVIFIAVMLLTTGLLTQSSNADTLIGCGECVNGIRECEYQTYEGFRYYDEERCAF